MTHLRSQKNCLNCDTHVSDRYCPHCGQENVEPKESFGHLIIHFFNDVTHFEGKFWRTIKVLFTKPGFLSLEYFNGRRASYVNPIRMFLFVSFAFFFLQFSINADNTSAVNPGFKFTPTAVDTPSHTNSHAIQNATEPVVYVKGDIDFSDGSWYNIIVNKYESVRAYDSIQKSLPKSQKDGWLDRYIVRRSLGFDSYMETHSETFLENLKEIFNHALPKALMISIPFFAFQLWLLYIRSRKKYFFVAHAIFTVHLYCAVYLYLLLMLPFDLIKLPSIVQTLIFPLLIFVPTLIYLFIAMKRFYQQGYGKTTLKFILLLMGSSVLFLLLTVGITFNALITLAVGAGH